MSNGFPSMTALLGLIAVAGYQNRDKIAEMLHGATAGAGAPSTTSPSATPAGGLLGNLGALFGGGSAGSLIGGGLSDLVDRFKQTGQEDTVNSWVQDGPNKQIAPKDLEQAIGSDTLATLEQHTGLSREELLARLSRNLPDAVDKYTPQGSVPSVNAN